MANTSRESSLRSNASHMSSTSSASTTTPSFDSKSEASVTESQNTTDGNVTGIEETATLPTSSSTYKSSESESISNNSTFKVLQKYEKYFWIRDLKDAGIRYNDSKAKCRVCREIITIRRGNTTGLRIHMKNEHGVTVTKDIEEVNFWHIKKKHRDEY